MSNQLSDKTYYDEMTLVRVQTVLTKTVGLDLDTAVNTITQLLNAGILFRERDADA